MLYRASPEALFGAAAGITLASGRPGFAFAHGVKLSVRVPVYISRKKHALAVRCGPGCSSRCNTGGRA